MNNTTTTPARYSQRLDLIRKQLDKVIGNNKFIKSLPALHDNDYDFYLKSVLDSNPLHSGDILYKGLQIKKAKK